MKGVQRLPLGGKLSRKRLMRGDQSALTKGIHSPTCPTQQTSAKPHSATPSHLPPNPKNFPVRQPPTQKREKFSHTNRRLPCREVRGDEGGLEEERRFCNAKSAGSGFAALDTPPKGGPSSSKVFLPLPPHIPPHQGNGKEGERNQDCKNDDPDNENRHGNV